MKVVLDLEADCAEGLSDEAVSQAGEEEDGKVDESIGLLFVLVVHNYLYDINRHRILEQGECINR